MTSNAPTYRIVVKRMTSTSPIDMTPANVLMVFDKATNIGYSEVVGNIPMLYFTLSQDDSDAMATMANTNVFGYDAETALPLHFLVYRNDELVWGGMGPMELDETSRDMIVYAYGYAAAAYWTLTGWKTEWSGQTIKKIVDDAWDAGAAKTNSMLAWMTKGTVEAPATLNDGVVDLTLPLYQANYKRILFLLREMASFSASDTTNRVWFEVTPLGTFNFWKDKGDSLTYPTFNYPNGNILNFTRYRMPVDMRTKLYGVGSTPNDVALQVTQENSSLSANRGLREDSIYMQWVRDSTELTRVTARRLAIATKVDKQITITLKPNSVPPIRAAGGLQLMADYPININKGSVVYNARKLLVGNHVVFTEGREYVRPIFQDLP